MRSRRTRECVTTELTSSMFGRVDRVSKFHTTKRQRRQFYGATVLFVAVSPSTFLGPISRSTSVFCVYSVCQCERQSATCWGLVLGGQDVASGGGLTGASAAYSLLIADWTVRSNVSSAGHFTSCKRI